MRGTGLASKKSAEVGTGGPIPNLYPLAPSQAALLCPLPFPHFAPYLPADPKCAQLGQDWAVARGQAVLSPWNGLTLSSSKIVPEGQGSGVWD